MPEVYGGFFVGDDFLQFDVDGSAFFLVGFAFALSD